MNKSLANKLIYYIMIIIVALNISLTVYIRVVLQNKLENQIISQMQNIKTVILSVAKYNTLIESEDIRIYEDISNEIRNNFQGVTIISKDKMKIYPNKGPSGLFDNNEANKIVNESKDIKSLLNISKIKNEYIATYNYPLYREDKLLGNIVIQKKFTKDLYINKQIILFISLGQVLMLIIAVVTLNFIIQRLISPLGVLERKMELFGDGEDVDDVDIEGENEINRLSWRFNDMKNTIIKNRRIKEDFFNNATHELKTPITSISAYTQIFEENNLKDLDDEFVSRATRRIILECNKMRDLVSNLLEVSRNNNISITRKKVAIEVDKLIIDITNDITSNDTLNKKGIIMKLNKVSYYGYEDDMKIIIKNLIHNGIKYSSDNSLDVILYKVKRGIVFQVENKINTIPDNIKNQLLEPFVKYNNEEVKEENISSSGLGLYICKSIAERNKWLLNYKIEDHNIKFTLTIQEFAGS